MGTRTVDVTIGVGKAPAGGEPVPGTFPDGTVIGAYPATSLVQGATPAQPRGVCRPVGPPVIEAKASDGQVHFTGLDENRAYAAAAKVDGDWRVVRFTAKRDPRGRGRR